LRGAKLEISEKFNSLYPEDIDSDESVDLDFDSDFYESETESCARSTEAVETARPIRAPPAVPWRFGLSPLSKKEETISAKRGKFPFSLKLPLGEYLVCPERYDLRVFHRKFWVSRAIKQLLIIVSSPGCAVTADLRWIRSAIFKYLGNGTKQLTDIQRNLLASVHYNFRKCVLTDYKSRESSNRATTH
jgi:hypothetical protein